MAQLALDDYPDRYALANELHARPFPELTAPCRALHLAIKQEGERGRARPRRRPGASRGAARPLRRAASGAGRQPLFRAARPRLPEVGDAHRVRHLHAVRSTASPTPPFSGEMFALFPEVARAGRFKVRSPQAAAAVASRSRCTATCGAVALHWTAPPWRNARRRGRVARHAAGAAMAQLALDDYPDRYRPDERAARPAVPGADRALPRRCTSRSSRGERRRAATATRPGASRGAARPLRRAASAARRQPLFRAARPGFLKWEMHTEFVTYTLFARRRGASRRSPARCSTLFPERLAGGGARAGSSPPASCASTRAERDAVEPIIAEDFPQWFVPESLAVSQVVDGEAVIAGDFRIDEHGHGRFAVLARPGIGRRRLGRIVQRLLEIETYKRDGAADPAARPPGRGGGGAARPRARRGRRAHGRRDRRTRRRPSTGC